MRLFEIGKKYFRGLCEEIRAQRVDWKRPFIKAGKFLFGFGIMISPGCALSFLPSPWDLITVIFIGVPWGCFWYFPTFEWMNEE